MYTFFYMLELILRISSFVHSSFPQVDGAVEPLGKFLLVKSAAAEEVTKAETGPVPTWSRTGNGFTKWEFQ